MRIGEAAKRAGVTVKAARYYEWLGLVTPARLPNGYRDYDELDVRCLAEIGQLGRLGIQAERTRPFLECLGAGSSHGDDCPESLAAYRDAVEDLDRRIAALAGRRSVLRTRLGDAARRFDAAARTEPPGGLVGLPPDLPVPEDDGGADHVPGARVPVLALPSTGGGGVHLDLLGPGRTVVYVYPLTGRPDVDLPDGWDAIPGARGCTSEACDFRDHHAELLSAGATGVFGLSSQDTAYQRELVARLRLPFPVLSDVELRLAGALSLPTFVAGGRRLYRRLTLVVAGGIVEHVFYPVFPPERHARQVCSWLADHPEPTAPARTGVVRAAGR